MRDARKGVRISFNCSNLVAAQSGYRPDNIWEQCVEAVNAYYAPLATFPARFEKMILHVRELGFDALDIWTPGQLNWRWATDAHTEAARQLLERHQMLVTSLGGDFGETREEFLSACRLAVGLGVDLLSGGCPVYFDDRAFVIDALEKYDLRFSLENHPEKTPQEMLEELGESNLSRIGTTVDTGWYLTRAFDPDRAIRELDGRIMHVHLKNVLSGDAHLNVGWKQGDVPMQACVQALKQIGYAGDYSVEEHAIDHDPMEEIAEARSLLETWLAS